MKIPKLDVAGSIPVARSKIPSKTKNWGFSSKIRKVLKMPKTKVGVSSERGVRQYYGA